MSREGRREQQSERREEDLPRREGQDESGKVRGNQQRRVQEGPGNSNRVCSSMDTPWRDEIRKYII